MFHCVPVFSDDQHTADAALSRPRHMAREPDRRRPLPLSGAGRSGSSRTGIRPRCCGFETLRRLSPVADRRREVLRQHSAGQPSDPSGGFDEPIGSAVPDGARRRRRRRPCADPHQCAVEPPACAPLHERHSEIVLEQPLEMPRAHRVPIRQGRQRSQQAQRIVCHGDDDRVSGRRDVEVISDERHQLGVQGSAKRTTVRLARRRRSEDEQSNLSDRRGMPEMEESVRRLSSRREPRPEHNAVPTRGHRVLNTGCQPQTRPGRKTQVLGGGAARPRLDTACRPDEDTRPRIGRTSPNMHFDRATDDVDQQRIVVGMEVVSGQHHRMIIARGPTGRPEQIVSYWSNEDVAFVEGIA